MSSHHEVETDASVQSMHCSPDEVSRRACTYKQIDACMHNVPSIIDNQKINVKNSSFYMTA